MELIDDLPPPESSSSTSSSRNQDTHKKMAPEYLLEESWFFGNLLDIKTSAKTTSRMSRCFSGPCPSTTNCDSEVFNVDSREKSLLYAGNLSRMPSLPAAFMGRKDDRDKLRDSIVEKTSYSLLRTTTLPPCFSTEEEENDDEDQESEFAMSKLIRQASLNSSSPILPSRRSTKSLAQSSSIPRRVRPQKKSEVEIIGNESYTEKRNQHQNNELKKVTKSLNELRFEEIKRFRDSMVSTSGKADQRPITLVNLEKSMKGNEDRVRKTHNIPAPPPIPNWDDRKSSAEDMKAHIKFWARAVASNVREEC